MALTAWNIKLHCNWTKNHNHSLTLPEAPTNFQNCDSDKNMQKALILETKMQA